MVIKRISFLNLVSSSSGAEPVAESGAATTTTTTATGSTVAEPETDTVCVNVDKLKFTAYSKGISRIYGITSKGSCSQNQPQFELKSYNSTGA